MALWGLSTARLIPETNRTAAVSYLLSLQNPQGNFNLTKVTSENSLSSLGPDKIAITALAILTLRDNGFNAQSAPILSALGFLSQAVAANFNGPRHLYDAALASLAFLQYYHPHEALSALTYLKSQQNSDGGFSDGSRSSLTSNALDTGWAAVALQYAAQENVNPQGPVNQPPKAIFTYTPGNASNGTRISFDATSSYDPDGGHLAYYWTFGDGSSASGPIVTHSYLQGGVYTVTLTVTDSGTNPNQLTGTNWNSINIQSSHSTSQAATQPSTTNLTLEAGLVVLALVVVAGGYLGLRAKKSRAAKKITA